MVQAGVAVARGLGDRQGPVGPQGARSSHRMPRSSRSGRPTTSAAAGGASSSSRSRSGSPWPTRSPRQLGTACPARAGRVPGHRDRPVLRLQPAVRQPGGGLDRAGVHDQPPTTGISFARPLDALTGGAVALAVAALILPTDPLRLSGTRPAAAGGAGGHDRGHRPRAHGPRRRRGRRGAGARPRHRRARHPLQRSPRRGAETARLSPARRRERGAWSSTSTRPGGSISPCATSACWPRGAAGAGLTKRAARRGEALEELAAAVRALAGALEAGEGSRPSARRARPGGGHRHARAREHDEPVRQRDRRPDPLDRHRL
jgi:hypothetical protein